MRIIITAFIMCFIVSACGKGKEPEGKVSGAMEEAPAQVMQDSDSSGMKVVDHTKDEKEFKIKRELWGVEDMIEDYKQHGYPTADLEKRKAELEQELDALNN